MMLKPLVSVIVSTYNSARFMRGLLDNLNSQSIRDQLEIIIIDSDSQQNELEIVKEYSYADLNINYLRTESRETVYSAWNRAILLSNASYITNANMDDRHHPQAFERMIRCLSYHPETALVYTDSYVTNKENEAFPGVDPFGVFRRPDFSRTKLFADNYIGPAPLWRRSLHDQYGLFDSSYHVAGDYEFWLRIAAAGEQFYHLKYVLGLYLKSSRSVEHSNAKLCNNESKKARYKYWKISFGEFPLSHEHYLIPLTTA